MRAALFLRFLCLAVCVVALLVAVSFAGGGDLSALAATTVEAGAPKTEPRLLPLPFTVPLVPPDQDACNAGWQSSQRVSSVDGQLSYVIEAQFDQGRAAGRLLRFPVAPGAGASVSLGTALWDAGALLDAGQPSPGARRVFTSNADGATIEFTWQALDPSARAVLDNGGDGLGEARVDYLRGDRSREGAPFRMRTAVLGEIVRSLPMLVGAPMPAAGGADYADFYRQYRDREKLVYAGANDGMLHAFAFEDGVERFAYIPAVLLPALSKLTDATSERHAYADGAPGRGEILVSGQWRTALASGMGMGARGVFALDITDPAAGPRALWEFTEADDVAIGYIHAPPLIVKLRSDSANTNSYRYFAMVTSGLDPANGRGDGTLFLLAFDKPVGTPWRRGQNYFRLDIPGGAGDSANSLAPPAVVLTADGGAYSAYAGDTNGVMWRFDLEGLAGSAQAGRGESARVAALFQARDMNGRAQAISESARVVFAPGGGYVVLFGTGRTIERADVETASFVQQSFYAIRDTDRHPMQAVAGRRSLVERRLTQDGEAFILTGEDFDYGDSGGAKHGWFFDFPRATEEGERIAGQAQLLGSAVVIVSTAPGTNRCAPVQRAYVVDSLSGLGLDRRGLTGDMAVTGRRVDGGSGDRAGTAHALMPLLISLTGGHDPVTPTGASRSWSSFGLFQPSTGETTAALDEITVSAVAGRLSWREIANWRELHDVASKPPP